MSRTPSTRHDPSDTSTVVMGAALLAVCFFLGGMIVGLALAGVK
jgi:hypothetical protein